MLKNTSFPYETMILVFMLVVLSGVFITPLVIDSDIHDPLRMGKVFFFAQWLIILIPVGIIAFMRNWQLMPYKLSLLILGWFIWLIVRGKTGGILYDEKFYWFAGCFAFYFITVSIFSNVFKTAQLKLFYIPVVVITLIGATEAIIGLLQVMGVYTIYHHKFLLTGTFFNPAPYAGFLVVTLPWVLLLISIKKNTILNQIGHWVGYITCCLIVVVIPSTQSRAGYLGLIASLIVWVFCKYKPQGYLNYVLNSRVKKWLVYSVSTLLIVGLFSTFYLFKKDSAAGRLLIWKVALLNISEQPIVGHGFNTVQATLSPSQSTYFAEQNRSDEEKTLAGSVQWTFNEALQTISETGIIGFLLLLAVIGYALFAKIPPKTLREFRLAIAAARSSIVGLCFFSLFSYPFYSLPITIMFFFSLAVVSAGFIGNKYYEKSYFWIKTRRTELISNRLFVSVVASKSLMLSIIVLLGLYYFIQTPNLQQAYWQWDKAQSYFKKAKYDDANTFYFKAYYSLKHNGLFLQQYGKSLELTGNYKEALKKITEGGNYYKDSFWYITQGNCLKALGEYKSAEASYMIASNMVPNKFYPEYLLAKLFDETNQNEKAKNMATNLLYKTVKIDSKAIAEIKKEMKEIVDKYESER